eukprot:TRINITY_DN3050_c0_g1_i1.p1 TRINITY_DN3050_c0_g1~~TRINITY_DN3050_c0_g1_i1.p1  ORF type:complete len:211 (+),score=45.24 TRINITY_DN3050_c0_g1_i1:49-681(+)
MDYYKEKMKDSQKLSYKLVFLGDQSVGKTSILGRFLNDEFDQSYKPTIGIDFLSKILHLEDKVVRLQLWDTAGTERFRSLISSYTRDCSVAVICYDITNEESFENIGIWMDEIQEDRRDEVIMILVGNKTDLEENRVIPTEQGRQKAEDMGMMFIESSAKTGDNINALFYKIAAALPGIESTEIAPETKKLDLKTTSQTENQDNQSTCQC